MRSCRASLLIAGAILFSSACEDSPTEPVEVVRMIVQPDTAYLVAGDTVHLAAKAFTADGGELSPTRIQWRSLDLSVAHVDEGVVTGTASGTTVVIADAGGRADTSVVIVRAPANGAFANISAGLYHTCALSPGGRVYCWGQGRVGQLGTGNRGEAADSPVPLSVRSDLALVQVSSGGSDTCGLTSEGAAYCWGSDQYGQLGGATSLSCGPLDVACATTPLEVQGGLRFRSISAGGSHTCAVTDADEAYCWGYTAYGRLGTLVATDPALPGRVVGGIAFTSVSASGTHTCGLARDGAAYCWGYGATGQIGDGEQSSQDRPTQVRTSERFVDVHAGVGFSCGLTADGRALCWGGDYRGVLGDGGASATPGTVVAVAGGHVFAALRVGGTHVCALRPDGAAFCWGSDDAGQLGVGGAVETCSGQSCSTAPVPVSSALRFTSLSAGYSHTCGVTREGDAYCWGSNISGALGTGTSGGRRLEPVRVAAPQ